MDQYGRIALLAATYVKEGVLPRDAWEKASWVIIPQGGTARQKGCPRTAFLALYDETMKSPNAIYARYAREYLRAHNPSDITPGALWSIVLNGEKKAHNSQMNVVLALYQNQMMP